MEHGVSVPHNSRKVWTDWRWSKRGHKNCGQERESKLGLFSLEGRSEGPSLQNSSTYRVTTKRMEPMEKARDKRHELYQKRIHPDIEKKFFTLRTINHWNNLPRNDVESPSPALLKVTEQGT